MSTSDIMPTADIMSTSNVIKILIILVLLYMLLDSFGLFGAKKYIELFTNEKPKIAVLLRGHIRKSLDNPKLIEFLRLLETKFNIDLYLSTWSVSEAKKSYRALEVPRPVTLDELTKYFNGQNIKNISIHNSEDVKLPGRLDGNLTPKCNMPIQGWKNFLWIINNGLSHIPINIHYDFVFSTRFDLFEIIQTTQHNINPNSILEWMTQQNKPKTIVFFKDTEFTGVDNLFLGDLLFLNNFSSKLLYKLDEILQQYPEENHQEYIFYREAKKH